VRRGARQVPLASVRPMRRVLVLLALLGACAFDGSGTRAGLDDDGAELGADAGRAGPSADPDPVRTPPPDAGLLDDDEDDVGVPDAAPPDAPADDDDEEACGGFGQACCEQGPPCEALLGCLGGTCL
jgi:hypothetical protein